MVTETHKSQMPNKEVATKRQQAKLLATRDRMLIEGNDWGDTFWVWSMAKGRITWVKY